MGAGARHEAALRRRTKGNVLKDLPEMKEMVLYSHPTNLQKAYEKLINTGNFNEELSVSNCV